MRIPDLPRRRERAINLPTGVLIAIGLLLAIHAVRTWLDDEDDLRLLLEFAFVPAPWSVAFGFAGLDEVLKAAERGAADPQAAALRAALAQYVVQEGAKPWSWLSYAALHGSWTHVAMNSVWLAAFASPVVSRAGPARSLVLSLAATLGGALAQWIADPLGVMPVIGASAIVSGLMAAAATFIFTRPSAERPWNPSRWAFLTNRNALTFLAIWLAANLVFGVVAVPLGLAEGSIAWQAHLGGLLTGLVLFPYLDPHAAPFARPRA